MVRTNYAGLMAYLHSDIVVPLNRKMENSDMKCAKEDLPIIIDNEDVKAGYSNIINFLKEVKNDESTTNAPGRHPV